MTTAPRQKKRRPFLWLILFALLIGSPFLMWQVQPTRITALTVVDKSVPNTKYREHEGLIWALNHYKFLPSTQNRWQSDTDYTGYYPFEGDPKKDTHELLQAKHLDGKSILFLADTYGVYSADLKHREPEAQQSEEGQDYSQLIFGGVKPEELTVIQDFAQKGGHVIAEFNTFASPTQGAVRQGLEDLLGVEWTGWAGRFFDNLSDMSEIPLWAPKQYKAQYGKKWEFTGPGWIFVHEDTRIFVLEEEKDIAIKGLRIHVDKPEDPLMKNTYSEVPFYFWVDILKPKAGSQVLASYHTELTKSGKGIFRRFGIPDTFPAVIRKQSQPLRLYFAGDFSDTGFFKGLHAVAARQQLESFGRFKEKLPTQQGFYWEFYLPLIHNTFDAIVP